MDDKKFAFIMCVNDEDKANEALYYISRLIVPKGYSIEDIEVVEAKSMTSGYNEGMAASDAKYKIYLHQDVMILNQNFLLDILDIFKDPKIGMIGCMGSPKMPENKMLWKARAVGAAYHSNNYETNRSFFDDEKNKKYIEVEALDGFLLATQVDIYWREDLFKNWDFYDISQSYEFRNKGYKIVTPHQENPWCLHDEGFLNYKHYYEDRKIFRKHYG